MDNLVRDEARRINAPEITSDFENEVMADIYAWASVKYENEVMKRNFLELRNEFWQEKFSQMGRRRIVR